MPLPRFVDINGRRYLWRDLVALRQAQAVPRTQQATLFELRDDHRPPGERSAGERYREPSLFTVLSQQERGAVPCPARYVVTSREKERKRENEKA